MKHLCKNLEVLYPKRCYKGRILGRDKAEYIPITHLIRKTVQQSIRIFWSLKFWGSCNNFSLLSLSASLCIYILQKITLFYLLALWRQYRWSLQQSGFCVQGDEPISQFLPRAGVQRKSFLGPNKFFHKKRKKVKWVFFKVGTSQPFIWLVNLEEGGLDWSFFRA